MKTAKKKPAFWILITAACLLVVAAVVVPVCLFTINRKPKPTFSDFDQKADISIQVVWKKVAGATSYEYQYSHDDPAVNGNGIVSGTTQNTKVNLPRIKGAFFFRVCAVKKNGRSDFSEWIRTDVEEWVLPKPDTVTIDSETATVSWTDVLYFDTSSRTNYSAVKAYSLSYAVTPIEEEVDWNDKDVRQQEMTSASCSLQSYLNGFVLQLPGYYEYVMQSGDPIAWPGDVVLSVRVRACNFALYPIGNTPKVDTDGTLYQLYGEYGDYAYAQLVVTEEIFNALRGA